MKKFNNVENTPYNVGDGKVIWDSRSVAVTCTVLAVKEGEHIPYVLVSKRGKNAADYQGLWNVIAGYLDKNEFGFEAAYREAWEEVGIDLENIITNENILVNHMSQPWFVNTDPSENRQNVSLRYGMCFEFKTTLPFLSLNYNEKEGEVDEALWILITEIDNYEWAFNHDKTIKQYYDLVLKCV